VPGSCSIGSRRRTKTKEKTETKEEKSEDENEEIDSKKLVILPSIESYENLLLPSVAESQQDFTECNIYMH